MTVYILYSLETGQKKWMVILGGAVNTAENGIYELERHLNRMGGSPITGSGRTFYAFAEHDSTCRIVSDSGIQYGVDVIQIEPGSVIDLR